MATVSAVSIIKLASEGKTADVMTALESAKEILVRRALRIAKRKQEIVAVVELKKILKKVAGTTITEIRTDDKIVSIYRIERSAHVDIEYFDAICEIAKAKRGRCIHATANASYYGYTDKASGSKFAAEATKRIESIAQCKGITITLDKDSVGAELARPKK
jgi:hypothetical protein